MHAFADYMYSDELWAFSPISLAWSLLESSGDQGPSERHSHAMTVSGTEIYVFGGTTNLSLSGELFFGLFPHPGGSTNSQ